MRRLLALGVLVTAAVPVAGGVAARSATERAPRAMVGCWQRHVGTLPTGTPAGVWLVKITRAGKLAAYTPGSKKCGADSDFTATVSAAGRRLTIGPVPLCPTKGRYIWKASAKTLTLRATADKSCVARSMLFTGVWKRR